MSEEEVKSDGPASGTPSTDQAGAATATAEAPAEADLDQLRADLEAMKDRLLRSQAELENYRKRAAREIEEHRRFANLPLMRDLLPVLDNIERSIAAAEKTEDIAALLEGVKLVARQFEDVLGRHHCTRIPALHQPFDPNRHHAIAQQPTDEFPSGTVILVPEAGFQLHDRVVRPSQVIVSTGKTEKENAD